MCSGHGIWTCPLRVSEFWPVTLQSDNNWQSLYWMLLVFILPLSSSATHKGVTPVVLMPFLSNKDAIQNKSGVIYRYQWERVECDDEYIGESSRTFGERFKEHLKVPSPIYDYYNTTDHNVTIENFSIVGRKDQNLCRWIKEALYIRVNNPSLNKNIGKYHLPHIWDEVLHNISELKLK